MQGEKRKVAMEEEEEGRGGYVGVAWNARGPRTVPIRRVYLLQPTGRFTPTAHSLQRPRVIYLPIPLRLIASPLSLP